MRRRSRASTASPRRSLRKAPAAASPSTRSRPATSTPTWYGRCRPTCSKRSSRASRWAGSDRPTRSRGASSSSSRTRAASSPGRRCRSTAASTCIEAASERRSAAPAVQRASFTLTAADGVALFVQGWRPEATPRGIVQIAHGLAEHGGRYARLAAALTEAGYAVYASDHRGHGRSARTPEDLGFFAAGDGWSKCLDDLWQLNRRLAADHPGAPIILLGHSMGSFMVQQLISEHGDALAGDAPCGSGGKPPPIDAARRTSVVDYLHGPSPRWQVLVNAIQRC